MFTRGQSPADAGMEALRLGVKNQRYTEARISGGFDHSPYAGTIRGVDNGSDDLHFDRAEGKVRAAAQEPSGVNARLVLARSHLARSSNKDANQARLILDQLSNSGIETPEVINDLGVAQFQLTNYEEAITYFTKALEKSPRFDEALFNRALAEQNLNRDAEARRDWEQFISQSTDENWKTEARSRLSRLSAPIDR
jgi:tetratricopeptide (TPR) repeat protein